MSQVFSFDGHLALVATATPVTVQQFTQPLAYYRTNASPDYQRLWSMPSGFSQVNQLYPQNCIAHPTPQESFTTEWLSYLPQAELLILEEEQLFALVQQLQLLDARSLVYLHEWSSYVDQCLLIQLMPFMLSAKFPNHMFIPRMQQLERFLVHTVPPLKWTVNPLTVTRSQLYAEIEHLWEHADPEIRKHLEEVYTRKSEFALEEQGGDVPPPSLFNFKLHIDSLFDLQNLERANHALLSEELQRYRNQIAQRLQLDHGILGDFSRTTRENLLRTASPNLRSCWNNIDTTLASFAAPESASEDEAEIPSATDTPSLATQLVRNFTNAAQQLASWEYLTLVHLTAEDQRLLQAQQAWSKFSSSTIVERLTHHATPQDTLTGKMTNPAPATNSLVQNPRDFSQIQVAPLNLLRLHQTNPEITQQLVELQGFNVNLDQAKHHHASADQHAPATLAQRNQQLQQRIEQQRSSHVSNEETPRYRFVDQTAHEWQVELQLQLPTPPVRELSNLLEQPRQVNAIPEIWDVTASVLAQSEEPQLRLHQLATQWREQLGQLIRQHEQHLEEQARNPFSLDDVLTNTTPSAPHAWNELRGLPQLPQLSPQLLRQLRKYTSLEGVEQAITEISQPVSTRRTQLAPAWWNQHQVVLTTPAQTQTVRVPGYFNSTPATATSAASTPAVPKAQPALAQLLRNEPLPLGMLLACHGDLRRLWDWNETTQYDFKHGLQVPTAPSIVDTPLAQPKRIEPEQLLIRLRATGYPTLEQVLSKPSPQLVPWSKICSTSVAELEQQGEFDYSSWNPAYYQALVGETYALDYRFLYSDSSNQLLAQATRQPYTQLLSTLGSGYRAHPEYHQAVAHEVWTSQGCFNLVSYALELLSLLLPQTHLVTILPWRGVVMRSARMHDAQATTPIQQRWSYYQEPQDDTHMESQNAVLATTCFPTPKFVGELVRNLTKGLPLASAITATLHAVNYGVQAPLPLSNAAQVGYLLLDRMVACTAPSTPEKQQEEE